MRSERLEQRGQSRTRSSYAESRKTSDEIEQSKREYEVILAAFLDLLDRWDNGAEGLEIITDIITHRSAFLVERVLDGMRLDFDEALSLLRNHNDFTTAADRQRRDVLIAAIENLVDFAAAGEY